MQWEDTVKTVRIIGTGSYLPGNPIPNAELEAIFGTPDEWISKQLGIKQRYWATDPNTGLCTEKNSDMAAKASLDALQNAGIKANEIDLIILSTGTPDYLIPATSPFVQEKIEVEECATIDIRAGCIGVIQAISIGTQFIRSGVYNTALLIGSELSSPFLTHKFIGSLDALTMSDRINALMYGDGASAVIIKGYDTEEKDGIIAHYMNSVGVGKKPALIFPAGGLAHSMNIKMIEKGLHRLKHDYKAISKLGLPLALRSVQHALKVANLKFEDVDKFIIPQTNPNNLYDNINHLIKTDKNFNWEEAQNKIFINADRVGDTGSAALCLALDEMNKRKLIKKGNIVMMVGAEASKWTYGGVVFKWRI